MGAGSRRGRAARRRRHVPPSRRRPERAAGRLLRRPDPEATEPDRDRLRLPRCEGNRLLVTGIDAWDGIPSLDLEGYSPRDELRPDAVVPDRLRALWSAHDAWRGTADGGHGGDGNG